MKIVNGAHRRDELNARVAVLQPGRATLWRSVRTASSYLSANDPRVLVGLGSEPDVREVQVYWLDGTVESWTELPLNEYTTLYKGEGNSIE